MLVICCSDLRSRQDFNELRQQLKEEGFFETSPTHVAFRIVELVALHVIGLWLISQGTWPSCVAGAATSTLLWTISTRGPQPPTTSSRPSRPSR